MSMKNFNDIIGNRTPDLPGYPMPWSKFETETDVIRGLSGGDPYTNKSLLTYLLTPWSRVLLEKLASLQLVKKFLAFYGTRRFLTALTSARHLSLS